MFDKVKFNELIKFLRELPKTAAEHAFLAFLTFLFLASILGGFIFYKYSILAERRELGAIEESVQFKENLYQEILREWQNREERFEEAELKECPDPFR